MKITLIGHSQLAFSVAWGICHNELAQKIAIYSGLQSGPKQVNRSTSNRRSTTDCIDDLTLSNAMSTSDTQVSTTNTVDDLSDSDIVVLLPASLPFGFHAAHTLKSTNLSFTRQIVPKIQEQLQNAILLVATPFANHMSAWIHQTQGVNNIIGIANGVSTAHLKSEIANRLGLSIKDVSALAIGNDEDAYPLPQYCRVNGIPLSHLMDESEIQNLVEVVTNRCPYTSASEFTLASHILQVVSTIALDKKRVMSAGTLITSETTSVFLNVPAKIGSNGIESIIPLDLTDTQRDQFKQLIAKSAASQQFN